MRLNARTLCTFFDTFDCYVKPTSIGLMYHRGCSDNLIR